MSKLDVMVGIWSDLEKAYETRGAGKTRMQFALALLGFDGSGDELAKHRSLLAEDLPHYTDAEIEAYTKLFEVIEAVRVGIYTIYEKCGKNKKKLESYDLDSMLALFEGPEEREVTLENFNVFTGTEETIDAKGLFKVGLVNSGTILNRGKVKCYKLDRESNLSNDSLKILSNTVEVAMLAKRSDQFSLEILAYAISFVKRGEQIPFPLYCLNYRNDYKGYVGVSAVPVPRKVQPNHTLSDVKMKTGAGTVSVSASYYESDEEIGKVVIFGV